MRASWGDIYRTIGTLCRGFRNVHLMVPRGQYSTSTPRYEWSSSNGLYMSNSHKPASYCMCPMILPLKLQHCDDESFWQTRGQQHERRLVRTHARLRYGPFDPCLNGHEPCWILTIWPVPGFVSLN